MENNWPDNLTIQRYLEGSLDKKLMHELEKRALEDPFLADALEGYAHSDAGSHGLSILQRQLHERIAHQQENKKVFDLSWQRLSVAAAAAVMFISAGVLFWMNSQLPQNDMAASEKHVEVNLAPVDTLPADNNRIANQAVKGKEAKIAAFEAVKSVAKPTVQAKVTASADNEVSRTAAAVQKDETLLSDKSNEQTATIASVEASEARSAKAALSDSRQMAARKSMLPELNEVVVSRFSSPEAKASPVDGWDAYNKYLQESVAKASEAIKEKGKVSVAIIVNGDGNIEGLRIDKGLSAAADSLALQIIRSGPQWKPARAGVRSTLSVDLNF